MNLKLYRNIGEGQVWFGFAFKRNYGKPELLATDIGDRFRSITPIFGGKYNRILVAYNYTQPLGSDNFSGGFHQITLGFDVWCKAASYACNCPATNNVN